MTFKRMVFWTHLSAGITASLLILLMSITGILLTYEHAIINRLETRIPISHEENAEILTMDQLHIIAQKNADDPSTLTYIFRNKANMPIIVRSADGKKSALNPYTGAALISNLGAVENFFDTTVNLHRWLALKGENKKTGYALTGAANLVFLFIIISGLYLWLPKIWKWKFIRLNILFRKKLPSAKARDYNWHHVFGIWAVIPLFFVVATGVIISYSWANTLVYKAFGETVPKHGGPPSMQFINQEAGLPFSTRVKLQDIYNAANLYDKNWTSMRMVVPASSTLHNIVVTQYSDESGLPKARTTLVFNRENAQIIKTQSRADRSPARRARIFIRFLHTGEIFGLWGQTVAGLASIAACFLAYTGLALSYRRLMSPLIKRIRSKAKPHA